MEVNLFLRGMFPLVGFKSTSVYYERHERLAGESHYPLSKMLALAFDGITSLSVKPIRMITRVGLRSFCSKLYWCCMGNCFTDYGKDNYWLGEYGMPGLFYGRNSAGLFGRFRRIYRENLYGSEG